MLQPLRIHKTEVTPGVLFDKQTGEFIIKGRSIMEDAHEFYLPLIHWIEEYCTSPNLFTLLELDIEYLNSASTRKLLNLVVELEKVYESGKDVKVIWKYEVSDDVMKERGEEIESVVELPFELVEE